ncbi:toll-interacting protein B-like [Nylanderia fulva]|uniref:toll-interacting protein B-like n=1 Tax=Nylanderia fulva TaxID=613905 RepID=UPI0010FAD19E|nr:toll-interacting protein B-like [Nylanderia fulva]
MSNESFVTAELCSNKSNSERRIGCCERGYKQVRSGCERGYEQVLKSYDRLRYGCERARAGFERVRSDLWVSFVNVYMRIYDECSFMMDELIAWGHIEIPPQVFQKGETHEDWYMLSGKQGENQEGMINLVFSYTNKCYPYMSSSIMMVPSATPMFGVPYAPLNVYIPPPAVATPTVAPSSLPNAEIELKQIAEMFPNIDKKVIESVYDANHGKKDVTISSLLQMCE